MKNYMLFFIVIMVVVTVHPGCTAPEEDEVPITTDFGRMLMYLPESLLAKHDIWFGNMGEFKRIFDINDINSIEELMNLPDDIPEKAGQVLSETGLGTLNIARSPELFPLVGFDVMSVDRALYGKIIPPQGFSILEGDFDEVLIGQKLIEQGYKETGYDAYSYYGIRGDFK